jgi:hypothetical protein
MWLTICAEIYYPTGNPALGCHLGKIGAHAKLARIAERDLCAASRPKAQWDLALQMPIMLDGRREKLDCRFLIFDFRLVVGIDSSATIRRTGNSANTFLGSVGLPC